MSENYSYSSEKRRHRSVFFPVLLILVGIFFLMSNLNMVSSSFWGLLVRFWPALFLIGAIDDLLNAKWVGAVFNFGIGGILLLANIGYFPWTAWEMIFRLWPVFIIAIGLDIVFRDQSIFGSLIGVSITALIIGAIVWFGFQSPLVGEGLQYEVYHKIQEAKRVDVRIQPSVAELRLSSQSNEDQLISGVVTLAEPEELINDYFEKGTDGQVTVSSQGIVFLPSRSQKDGFLWDLDLNDSIRMDLEVDQGVGQQILNLKDLNIEEFSSDLGVGQMIVTLPADADYDAYLNLAIGEIVIRIPEDEPVKFILDTAITAVDYPAGYIREDGIVYPRDIDPREIKHTVYVDLAIGSLEIVKIH